MPFFLDRTVTQNFSESIGRKWLETNGIGGWASSTISNAHTRRYHGLLAAATRPPVGRVVLLSKLDKTLVRVRGKTGRKQGLKLVQVVQNHLSESGIGQISEIFDGDAPHASRGCIAQAWRVAEIVRAHVEDLLDAGPGESD